MNKQTKRPPIFWVALTIITLLITACLGQFAYVLFTLLRTTPYPTFDEFGTALTPAFSIALAGGLVILSILHNIDKIKW